MPILVAVVVFNDVISGNCYCSLYCYCGSGRDGESNSGSGVISIIVVCYSICVNRYGS